MFSRYEVPAPSAIRPRQFANLVATYRAAKEEYENTVWSDNPGGWEVAKTHLTASRVALREALLNAPRVQNGSVFVTERSDWPAGNGYTRTLYMQGRRLATCTDRGWLELVDPATAEAEYLKKCEEGRDRDLAYKEERRRLIADLEDADHDWLGSFGGWRYTSGQNGGTFHREGTGIWVAANSALRAAVFVAADSEENLKADRRHYGARHL